MQRSLLLDQLIKLTKLDYPDDYVRFGHLACAVEGEAVSLDEAVRRRLRMHGRYDLAAFSPRLAHEVSASRALCKKFVEHFADVFRNQMVGRTKGSRETKPLEPALIRPEALRFDPDELVLDKGELPIVCVRVEPASAPLPNPSAAPVHKLSGKAWVPVAFERRREELLAMEGITDGSHALAEESKTALDCARPLNARYIEKLLRQLNVWAKARRNSPEQSPK
jgi:hypothetical protein